MQAINLTYRKELGNVNGKEIFEVHPVILGGSLTDVANKVALTREQHIETVRYWNKVIKDLRSNRTNCNQNES